MIIAAFCKRISWIAIFYTYNRKRKKPSERKLFPRSVDIKMVQIDKFIQFRPKFEFDKKLK